MTIFVYEPSITFGLSTPTNIATRGITFDRIPLNMGTDGLLRPVFVETNLIFSGTALISVRLDYFPEGQLVLDGSSAPTSATINGQNFYTYPGIGTLNLDGSAPVSFNQADGTIEYVYVPVQLAPITFDGTASDAEIVMNYASVGDGITFDGASTVEITQDYVANDGGIIFDGTSVVAFINAEVGGRGMNHRSRRVRQPVIFQHEPSIYRKDAWNFRFFNSATTFEYVEGKKYSFITDLPKYVAPRDTSKSFILSLPKKTPLVYDFVSEITPSNIKITSVNSEVEFYDHNKFLVKQDDEIIAELMLDTTSPLIAVTYDNNINRIRKDDEYVIENFLL